MSDGRSYRRTKKSRASAKPKHSRTHTIRNSENTKRRPSIDSIRIIWSSSRPNTRATPANNSRVRTTRNQNFDRRPVANHASTMTRLSTAKKALTLWMELMETMAWMALTAPTTSRRRHQTKPELHPPAARPTPNATASSPSPEALQSLLLPQPTRPGDPVRPTIRTPRCIATRPSLLSPRTKTRAR